MNTDAKHLLQALNRLTHGDPMDGVRLDMLSASAKTPHLGAALNAAILLEAGGFVRLERSTRLEENRLQITGPGVAEAARQQLGFWKRWANNSSLVQQLVLLCIGALLTVAGGAAVRWLIP